MNEKMSKRQLELRLKRMSYLAQTEIRVERWAPGDKAKYRVMRARSDGGEDKMSQYVPYNQLEAIIDAMQNVFELMSERGLNYY